MASAVVVASDQLLAMLQFEVFGSLVCKSNPPHQKNISHTLLRPTYGRPSIAEPRLCFRFCFFTHSTQDPHPMAGPVPGGTHGRCKGRILTAFTIPMQEDGWPMGSQHGGLPKRVACHARTCLLSNLAPLENPDCAVAEMSEGNGGKK
jgi:hypothetical protein